MKLSTLTAAIVGVCVVAIVNVGSGKSQTSVTCPYGNGLPAEACSRNPNTDPIPSSLGGSPMGAAECASVVDKSFASLFSYTEPSCNPAGGVLAPQLKVVGNALDYLRPYYYRQQAEHEWNFHATLYCNSISHTLILAYRGSAELTPLLSLNQIEDWIATNVFQHLGSQPDQYGVGSDLSDEIKDKWMAGDFDSICGPGRPAFVLTGHSKGGGQAQFAAVRSVLDTVVFNSDPVNPAIYINPPSTPDGPLVTQLAQILREKYKSLFRSIANCYSTPLARELDNYYASGKTKDVRMVNDFFAKYFFPYCHLPHAQFEWLEDTLTCSANDGHALTSIIRELRECSPAPPP